MPAVVSDHFDERLVVDRAGHMLNSRVSADMKPKWKSHLVGAPIDPCMRQTQAALAAPVGQMLATADQMRFAGASSRSRRITPASPAAHYLQCITAPGCHA